MAAHYKNSPSAAAAAAAAAATPALHGRQATISNDFNTSSAKSRYIFLPDTTRDLEHNSWQIYCHGRWSYVCPA